MDASFSLHKSVAGTDALDISKLYDVSGRVAVVTGGGTGLGLVTATALAENGVRVYITGRRLEPLEAAAEFKPRKGNGCIIPIQADLGTKDGIKALVEAVSHSEKFVNILINNHGIFRGRAKIGNPTAQSAEEVGRAMFDDVSWEDWTEVCSTHCASPYFTTAAFLPLLAAAKDHGFAEPGNVIQIASLSGITRTSQRGQMPYNVSKAGTIHLALMQSTEFARRGLGIRVNAVSPGYFPSGMSVSDFEDKQGEAQHWRDEYGIPFQRVGSAVDYAQCIIGLVVNQYITGTNVIIDGAWLAAQGGLTMPLSSMC
ncbi:uncharacterized protein COLE_05731 [Cutaneotrichosporon oleaginosum]|uniref:uncharacterized protein n=1 Tax=Cutaneotrichosporon oleaginosum TaxID=879819 RepID=UPI001322008C|nr:hypothetical protein COLE_05731 [Cutaneotrichosporon oleaginosum]